MIEYQCPHCQRVLKVPEKFIGVEGACNYCGTRLTIPADVVASGREGVDSDVSSLETSLRHDDKTSIADGAAIAQLRLSVERLSKDLENERVLRLEAQAAREVAEERIAQLEKKLSTLVSSKVEADRLRADIDRLERLLDERGEEVEHLHVQLGEARGRRDPFDERPAQLSDSNDSNLEQPASVMVAKETQIVKSRGAGRIGKLFSLFLLLVVIGGFIVVSVCRPTTAAFSGRVQPVIDAVRNKMGLASSGDASLRQGASVEVHVSFIAMDSKNGSRDVPASNVPTTLIPLRLDMPCFTSMLEEAGVQRDNFDAVAKWFLGSGLDSTDARLFLTSTIPADAACVEARMKMFALRQKLGEDLFMTRIFASLPFAPRSEWREANSASDGRIAFEGVTPGAYFACLSSLVAGVGIPTWRNGAFVFASQTRIEKVALHPEDVASAIKGMVVDAETGKPIGRAPLSLMGDVVGGGEVVLQTLDDGTFGMDMTGVGYGAFSLNCAALPKGYLSSSGCAGVRSVGVKLEPLLVRLSKKAPTAQSQQTAIRKTS